MKLALLVADRPADCVVNAYGDYVQMFTNLLTDASKSLAGRTGEVPMNLELTPFTLQSMELPTNIDDFDALLITGSSKYFNLMWIV